MPLLLAAREVRVGDGAGEQYLYGQRRRSVGCWAVVFLAGGVGYAISPSFVGSTCTLPQPGPLERRTGFDGLESFAGFKISVVFRRNFGEYFVFGGNRKMVYRCFLVFSVSNFKISKKNYK